MRPVPDKLVFKDRYHYLITHRKARPRTEYLQSRNWLSEEAGVMM